eukprot:TRINITY_DN13905_c0_g1_i1.p2 TRINITY_DN13905_c0_g1~~TRINITY_DN13905_c0_g1_i1.p2  ORF type:complete len:111 (-),score=48.47 TRINITY_DN13905_c0_g1_i1:20-313(-)
MKGKGATTVNGKKVEGEKLGVKLKDGDEIVMVWGKEGNKELGYIFNVVYNVVDGREGEESSSESSVAENSESSVVEIPQIIVTPPKENELKVEMIKK